MISLIIYYLSLINALYPLVRGDVNQEKECLDNQTLMQMNFKQIQQSLLKNWANCISVIICSEIENQHSFGMGNSDFIRDQLLNKQCSDYDQIHCKTSNEANLSFLPQQIIGILMISLNSRYISTLFLIISQKFLNNIIKLENHKEDFLGNHNHPFIQSIVQQYINLNDNIIKYLLLCLELMFHSISYIQLNLGQNPYDIQEVQQASFSNFK
ncbi:unnamed protein product [Paramecium sonneborni]|uniref:Uncharacterized protein n=1 Tax=Paramecium sonneborni TaxID=65129 RepID=A0A8S1RWC9_9CILI|nr:unnamed protein product [Paramecium sonneborni]